MSRALKVILVLLFLVIAVEGYRLVDLYSINRTIAEGGAPAAESERGEIVFAQAYLADRKGESQAALGLYQRVRGRLKLSAQYNGANILLRQAIEIAKTEGNQRGLPIFELAKESYRGVLREAPRHWDAKYNLERALKLAPEAVEGETIGRNPDAERAVTTMRGFTLGLP